MGHGNKPFSGSGRAPNIMLQWGRDCWVTETSPDEPEKTLMEKKRPKTRSQLLEQFERRRNGEA